jgi:polyhydroxyalkanoate synthesis regulator phasin
VITEQSEAGSYAQHLSNSVHRWTANPVIIAAPVSRPSCSLYSINMARNEAEGLMDRLRQMSEEGVSTFLNEMMANDAWRRRLGRAGERFVANKQSFDRNVETILDFVNIPSKRDVRELKTRLDHLSGQLVNLSMKIDRLLAESEPDAIETKPRPARPRPRRKKE